MVEFKNSYILLGLGLILVGLWLAPVAHLLLDSTPLSALGVCLIILGAVCFVLGRTRPKISPEVSAILLETGLENISTIAEQISPPATIAVISEHNHATEALLVTLDKLKRQGYTTVDVETRQKIQVLKKLK